MARRDTGKGKDAAAPRARPGSGLAGQVQRVRARVLRLLVLVCALALCALALFRFVDPPTTYTIWSEKRRLGDVAQEWVPLRQIAPVMARSAMAGEDANFCRHWGFDMQAIRSALDAGGERGASTISQQAVKNVYLWQGRSWLRKAIEALLTPGVELIWGKPRIMEIYLNVAEFGEGVFGVDAAARKYFKTAPADLSPRQAALLAAVLPDPKGRSPLRPSRFVQRRAAAIEDGAETLRQDGRAACLR